MPPPGSGGLTAIQIPKLLEELEVGRYDLRSPEKYHLLAEAMHKGQCGGRMFMDFSYP